MEVIINDELKHDTINTNGCVVLYIEGENIRVTGRISMKSLMPLISKLLIEKMTK